jgi:hypothetical protein
VEVVLIQEHINMLHFFSLNLCFCSTWSARYFCLVKENSWQLRWTRTR